MWPPALRPPRPWPIDAALTRTGGPHATARSRHPPPGVRHRALAAHPAGGPGLVQQPHGARVPAHRRAHRHRHHPFRRRLQRGDRVPGHQGARRLARRYRGRGRHLLHQPAGAKPDHGALLPLAGPRLGRRRRARQGQPRATTPARRCGRTHHCQGRGRRHAGDLARAQFGHRLAAAAQRPGQPPDQAAPADRSRCRRRAHLWRAALFHARLARPRPPGRVQPHHAGRGGRAAPL